MSARLSLVAAVLLAACNTVIPSHRVDPSSFKVEVLCAGASAADCPSVSAGAAECPAVTSPADLGQPAAPVDRAQRFYMAQVTAIGQDGQPYAPYEGTANVYTIFEGTSTPPRNALTAPMATLPFKQGKACLATTIPPAFNETVLWIEDSGPNRAKGSFAVGVSPKIYRPAPLISDIEQAVDPDTTLSPLDTKHVLVSGGTGGKPIVVTAVFSGGFMVTDLGAPDPDYAYGSLYVYSYSQPAGVQIGMTVKNLNGTLSAFHGLNELNFPIWEFDDATADLSRVPAPHLIKPTDVAKVETMLPWRSALVQTDEWVVCNLTGRDLTSWQKYQQWKIAPKSALAQDKSCTQSTSSISIISNATVPSFDPTQHTGDTVCHMKGILSQVIPAPKIHLWMITPRDANDLGTVTANPGDCH